MTSFSQLCKIYIIVHIHFDDMGIPQTVYPWYHECTFGLFPVWNKSYCYRHSWAYSLVHRYTNFIWYTTGSEKFGSQWMNIFNLILPIISKVLISILYASSHHSTFSPTLSIMILAFANLVVVQPNVFSRKYSWPRTPWIWTVHVHLNADFFNKYKTVL